MSCGGGHLGFPIGIKNTHLVEDLPMIIPELPRNDHWKVLYKFMFFMPIGNPRWPPPQYIGQFGFNYPSGFREEAF
jgi:hypothetical protein